MNVIESDGEGPTVLCVHGFCQSSAYWRPSLDRLAATDAHCLAVDLPGFGGSVAEPGPYTMEAFADALAQLLDRKGVASVALVGGSMGGVVAQHFALRHPTRVSRLLLAATGAYTADPDTALGRANALGAATWDEETVAPMVNGFFYKTRSESELRKYCLIALAAAQSAAVAAARSNARSRTLDRLGEIVAPTLIIQGRHDRARTPEHGVEMRDRIVGARLEILEQSGHTPQLEQPHEFHALALPFLLGRTI